MSWFYGSIFVIFVSSIWGLGRTVVAQGCSNQTQEICLDFLRGGGLDLKHIDDDLPSWNETADMLQRRCKVFDDFSGCIKTEIDRCSGKELATYTGWIDAYSFLCKESNLTVVADYLDCYTSQPVATRVETVCRKVFQSKVNILLNGSSTVPKEKQPDYCKLADAFFDCINETLTNDNGVYCGKDAASWQWTWDRKLSTPSLYTCPGWSPPADNPTDQSPSAWTIALIVVLVLITAIMVLVVAFLVIFLFRKRKERTRVQQMRRRANSAAPPPPPYAAVMYSSTEPGAEPQAHLVDSSIVVSPGELSGQTAAAAAAATSVRPQSDVVLPPPYMGEDPPAPEYKSPEEETKQVDGKEGVDNDGFVDEGKKGEEKTDVEGR